MVVVVAGVPVAATVVAVVVAVAVVAVAVVEAVEVEAVVRLRRLCSSYLPVGTRRGATPAGGKVQMRRRRKGKSALNQCNVRCRSRVRRGGHPG